MYRLPTLALAALLLGAVAAPPPGAPPPGAPQPGMPQPAGPPAPPMETPGPAPTPPGQPTPTPTPNAAMLARAKSWFAQLQAGKIDRSQLAPGMGSITDEQVKGVAAQIGDFGAPVTFEQQQAMTQGGISYVVYLLTFRNGKKLDFGFAVDHQGKVAALRLTPAP
jgi:hypothetical protein